MINDIKEGAMIIFQNMGMPVLLVVVLTVAFPFFSAFIIQKMTPHFYIYKRIKGRDKKWVKVSNDPFVGMDKDDFLDTNKDDEFDYKVEQLAKEDVKMYYQRKYLK